MANVACPKCGCMITVDRGVRRKGIVYCCLPCVEAAPCTCGCPERQDPARGAGGVGVIVRTAVSYER